jgi:FdhD protein
MEPFTRLGIVRVRGADRGPADDVAATEAPLELRVQGRPLAVIMRTPGGDRELAAGFLLAERIIRRADDLGTIEYCTDQSGAADAVAGSIVNVTLDPEAADSAEAVLASRRQVMTSAACGVCGRESLASMRTDLSPVASDARVAAAVVASLPERLRARQPLFASTGGIHAAGIFDAAGEPLSVAEDVGRHNAVDKAIGSLLLRDALPLPACILCVSGRTSYEIVQKAWCAGVPIVASVSAPSSLAVSLASEAGITLVGFVRDGGLNIYTGAARIV